jgi:hypothetical protein
MKEEVPDESNWPRDPLPLFEFITRARSLMDGAPGERRADAFKELCEIVVRAFPDFTFEDEALNFENPALLKASLEMRSAPIAGPMVAFLLIACRRYLAEERADMKSSKRSSALATAFFIGGPQGLNGMDPDSRLELCGMYYGSYRDTLEIENLVHTSSTEEREKRAHREARRKTYEFHYKEDFDAADPDCIRNWKKTLLPILKESAPHFMGRDVVNIKS